MQFISKWSPFFSFTQDLFNGFKIRIQQVLLLHWVFLFSSSSSVRWGFLTMTPCHRGLCLTHLRKRSQWCQALRFSVDIPSRNLTWPREKWCLEDYFPIGKVTFQGLCLIREGKPLRRSGTPWKSLQKLAPKVPCLRTCSAFHHCHSHLS